MSAAASAWARGAGARGSRQAVLVALAGYHNARTGECRPGIDALCRDAGLSRPTVIAALKGLRDAGFIDWIKGADARGHRATNIYVLHGVIGKPKVKLANSGGNKPKVKSTDSGFSEPELSSLTRLSIEKNPSHEETIQAGRKAAMPPPYCMAGSRAADVERISRNGAQGESPHAEARNAAPDQPAVVAMPSREPSPAQVDSAIAGAREAFDAADDPHNPEAWAWAHAALGVR